MKSCAVHHAVAHGFSLLELILVIVLLSLASLPVLGGFNQVNLALQVTQDNQIALQLAQAQAEALLADKRRFGYNAPSLSVGGSTQTLTAPYDRYDRKVTIAAHTSATLNGCPATANCKLVQVEVYLTGGGRLLAAGSFMVVE